MGPKYRELDAARFWGLPPDEFRRRLPYEQAEMIAFHEAHEQIPAAVDAMRPKPKAAR